MVSQMSLAGITGLDCPSEISLRLLLGSSLPKAQAGRGCSRERDATNNSLEANSHAQKATFECPGMMALRLQVSAWPLPHSFHEFRRPATPTAAKTCKKRRNDETLLQAAEQAGSPPRALGRVT